MERGLKVRANHRCTKAPLICADLRPATLCFSSETQPGRRFRLRGPYCRTGLVLARTFGPKCPGKMCILVRIEIHGYASGVATRRRAGVAVSPRLGFGNFNCVSSGRIWRNPCVA